MPPTEYTKETFDKEVDALVTKMRAYEPKVDGKTIHAAFDYALKMHGAQARESGEPYVVHPLKVAEILADMEMDQTPSSPRSCTTASRTPRPPTTTSSRPSARTLRAWSTA